MQKQEISFLEKLSKVKAEIPPIPKNKEAYGYNYAPLDTILPLVEPILQKHRVWYYHRTDYDTQSWRTYLETVIYDLDNPVSNINSKILIDEDVQLAKMNKYMVLGSALTYFRRYHLVVMLGLLTDEDNDAGSVPGGGRSVESKPQVTDYVKTFKGLIENGKGRADVEKFFKNYEKHFNEEQRNDILSLIEKSYGGK